MERRSFFYGKKNPGKLWCLNVFPDFFRILIKVSVFRFISKLFLMETDDFPVCHSGFLYVTC